MRGEREKNERQKRGKITKMGSSEEEKLLQMVHDFIESESSVDTSSSPSSAQKHVHFGHSTIYFTLQEIMRKKTEEERRIVERVEKHMRNKMELEKTSGLKQWLVKCLKLDGFYASLCHTSWVTTPGCPCGNYEYIEVVEEDTKGKSHRIIVDIDLRSQFEVARPTQSYTELSSKLPIIFVGNENKLKRMISIMCSAAEDSLREKGLHIPPWRRATYMQSKWKLISNNNCTDHHVPSRFGEWVPPALLIKGRIREMDGGSRLCNHFSNMSINCC